ncbi:MAG TPA: phosphotransferase, partial [Vicinamibacteria bacterium]
DSAQLSDLLASHGLRCAKLESLSPPGRGRKAGRRTLRVETREGRVHKVRLFESAQAAAALAALRARVDVRCMPPIELRGPLLLEPWIEGERLSPEQAEARADELGRLLGQLHAARPADAPARISSRERRERAEGDLLRLGSDGVIAADAAASLREELARRDPGSAPAVLVHLDFCPENLVVDPAGRLHLIDNEWLCIEAAGVDLGRTWSRWPISDAAWQAFSSGYAGAAPEPPEALRFWLIAMAARSASVRLAGPGEAPLLPLARLRELASGGAA